MQELKSGIRLADRYTLRRRLGATADVEVWLAGDRATRADVALKILVSGPERAAALRREWQLSLRLMHPHIVRVFEFHEPETQDEPAFFSLQYVDGASIGVLSGAPVEAILPPVALVADALRYAHGKRIVHRDLKAANVLLDANGAPCIIDFGVATAAGEIRGGGSPIAASPQVLAGEPPAPGDDIFALGGLLYELLSGRSPWSSATTLEDIRTREPAPLTLAGGGDVPPVVAKLVTAMLAKDASARPDAETVVDRIRQAGFAAGPAPRRYVAGLRPVGDVLIDAGPARPRHGGATRPVPTAGMDSRRRGLSPGIVGAALLLLIAALVAVVFLLPDAVEPPQSAKPAEESPMAADADEPAADAAASGVPERDARVQARQATEEILGRLLAQVKTLEARAVDRWGGLAWKTVQEQYAAGDEAYLAQDYEQATEHYAAALETIAPLLTRVDDVFEQTLADARAALESGDAPEALRLFELAVAISPGHAPAKAGLERARNLDRVLALTEQGLSLERNLELDAARDSFARAVEIDPEWQAAADGLARVSESIRQNAFDARMSEGLNALAAADYRTARAAFRMAQELDPGSSEPADGLLQVDQGLRLEEIAALENEAQALEEAERWKAASETYEKILELDANLAFAQEGRARAGEMVRLHEQLDEYLADPDSLSADRTMQRATQLVVDITRMDAGPRLVDQRDELARLLKRAATPLNVTLVSDEQTNVSVYKVGRLGTFDQTELVLRPGTYVAVGSRPGFRDVRREFLVAPEIDMEPVVVKCEEPI